MPMRHRKTVSDLEEGTVSTPGPVPPAITSISFDQPSYTPGQTITATVTYTSGMAPAVQEFTGTATAGAQEGTLTVAFEVMAPQPTTVTAADTGNRTWTQKSDTGTVAVLTATA